LNRTVVPINAKRAGGNESGKTIPDMPGRMAWPAASFPDMELSREWLLNSVSGQSYEGMAISLWTHHPNLRESTVRLVHYLSPMWPAADGRCLLNIAVQQAVRAAERAVDNREAFEGRLIGVYLHGLVSVVPDIARLDVMGVDAAGMTHRWQYFSKPLKDWAHEYSLSSVFATPRPALPSDVVLSGLKTHLTACLTNPVDAGYLAKYAPQG
jgi:hypothetical protein